jgi:hypothetical protein
MIMEGDRVGSVKMSPSSGWLGLSVFRLGNDDLLAAAPCPLAALRGAVDVHRSAA